MVSKKLESARLGSRYILQDLIGRGGMGAVYLATDRLTSSTVALKHVTTAPADLMFASRGSDPSNLHLALAQEFKTLASLRHPNIVSVLDYGFDDQRQPYFTMEYVPGAHTIVEAAEAISTAEKVELLVQVLQALMYLHRRNILHRDLKPGNVLVTGDGKVKVLDFGLSRVSRQTVTDITQTTSGTFAYMAPELLQGRQAHRGSDLYAVGMIGYEMFTGHFPYNRSNIGVLAVEIMNKAVDLAGLDGSVRPVVERLLAKDPDERYRRARQVLDDLCNECGAASLLPQMETTELRESFLQAAEFVGREAELAQLTGALADAIGGQGSLWLIGGESGVGKTRLCEELRARALVEGAQVLRGHAISEGGAPYSVWQGALRHLSLQTALSDLEASVLKPLVPDIGHLIGREVPDAPEVDPASAQRRFLSTVQDVFERQAQPMTVILEDLQWASESLAVLARLGRSVGQHALLMIGTYRIEEVPDLPARTGLDVNAPEVHQLKLERLDEQAIADLSASMLGEEAGRQERIVRLLQRETEGNVFFVIEVLRALAEEAGQLDRIASMTLPRHVYVEGIEMRRRLLRVPEAARSLLRVAAVAGRELDLAVLQATSAGRVAQGEAPSLEGWLAVCVEALMLEVGERGAQGDRWRFCHDKLRERLLAAMPAEEKTALHRQVAGAIEKVHPDDPAQAALLAHHWREAGDISKETHYTALAGVYALSNGVYKDALPFLERALAQAEQAGLPALRRAELESCLGETLDGLGQPHASIAHCERALAALGWHVPTTTFGYFLCIPGEILRQVGHRLMADVFGRSLKVTIEPAVVEIVEKSEWLINEQSYVLQRSIPVTYHILRHINLAERGGDAGLPGQAAAFGLMAVLVGSIELYPIAEFYWRKSERALNQCRDYDSAAVVAQCKWAYGLMRGRWAWADPRSEADQAKQWGYNHRYSTLRAATGHTLYFQARWDEQQKLMADTLEFCRRQNDYQWSNVCLWHLAEVALRRGNHARAFSLLEECQAGLETLQDIPHLIGLHGMRAQIHAIRGDMDLARQSAVQALKMMSLPLVGWALSGYAGMVEYVLMQLEQRPSLHHRWEAFRVGLHMRLFAFVHDTGRPRLAVYNCWLAGLLGQRRQAKKIARNGIKLAQKMGMPYEEGLLHYHAGRFLPQTDPARREHLTQALAIFERLGAAYDADCVRRLL